MAFFRNDRVNWLNLHYAIHALALSGGGAFLGAFLLHAGVPAPGVLVAWAITLGGRFLLRPWVLPLARRVGLRALVIAGAVLVGAEFPILARVHGVGSALFIYVAFSAGAETLYWTCYHAYFASLGDSEHRGHQIGAREAIAAVVGIVGPLATGWALNTLGPGVAFWTTGLVLAASALPLLATPKVAVLQTAPGAFAASWGGVRLFAADGWIGSGTYLVWQIALFISLGESYTAFGAAMALAALVGAISGLILGRWIDLGHGTKAAWAATGAIALGVIFRGVAFGSPILAVAANAAAMVVAALYIPTLMTAVYNQAKDSPCALRFHIATEGGYDAGCAAGLLLAAGLLWAKVPMGWVLLLPLAGIVVQAAQLRGYYGAEDPLKPIATI
jgi:hypothetical protein